MGFVARHLIGAKVRGRFTRFDGSFTVADPAEDSHLEASVETASIETGVELRDDHLRTNDFLDAPDHPTITVRSTGFTRVGDTEWTMATDLTIRGVTRPVAFHLQYHGTGPGMQAGAELVAFSATGEIDRRDFGVSWSGALDNGVLVVGNKVRIEIEVEAGLQS